MTLTRPLPAHVLAAMARSKALPSRRPASERAEPAKKRTRRGAMNKTEAGYAMELEARKLAGEIAWFAFEAIKLRLADGAWYTPDFAVLRVVGDLQDHDALEFHEVKGGFIREAALVRLKVAASMYPFRFLLVQITRDGRSSKVIGAGAV